MQQLLFWILQNDILKGLLNLLAHLSEAAHLIAEVIVAAIQAVIQVVLSVVIHLVDIQAAVTASKDLDNFLTKS